MFKLKSEQEKQQLQALPVSHLKVHLFVVVCSEAAAAVRPAALTVGVLVHYVAFISEDAHVERCER